MFNKRKPRKVTESANENAKENVQTMEEKPMAEANNPKASTPTPAGKEDNGPDLSVTLFKESMETALAGMSDASVEKFKSVINQLAGEKEGFEEDPAESAWLPRVKIRQGMSNDAPDNVKMGDLYTDTGVNIGQEFAFLPLYMYKTHRRFADEASGIESCSSEDTRTSIYGDQCALCPDLPFRGGKLSNCNKTVELIAYAVQLAQLVRISFMKTSYRAGAQIFRQAKSSEHAWAKIFRLTTEPRTRQGSSGNYYIFTSQVTGESPPEDESAAYAAIQKLVGAQRKAYMAALQDMAAAQEDVLSTAKQTDGASVTDDYSDL